MKVGIKGDAHVVITSGDYGDVSRAIPPFSGLARASNDTCASDSSYSWLVWGKVLSNNNNDIGFGTTSYDNKFFHNNFVNNGVQVIVSGVNKFDGGYPSGGNYWSDYTGVDNYRGKAQNKGTADGIGDTPYPIDTQNVDNYPLMQPIV